MPRRLALPLAIATALAISACSSAEPGAAPPDAAETADASTQTSGGSASSGGGSGSSASGTQEGAASQAQPADAASTQDAPADFVAAEASLRRDAGVPGLPADSGASVDDVLRLGGIALWADAPDLIALSLPASSGCWAMAAAPVAATANRLVIEVEQPAVCGAPDAARTYTLPVPEGTDTGAPLELVVVGLVDELVLQLPQA